MAGTHLENFYTISPSCIVIFAKVQFYNEYNVEIYLKMHPNYNPHPGFSLLLSNAGYLKDSE